MKNWYVIAGLGQSSRLPLYLREDRDEWEWVYNLRSATFYPEPPVAHRFVYHPSRHPTDRKIIEVSEDDLLVEDMLAQL